MATFLPQARPVVPGNAQVDLSRFGEAVGGAITDRRRRNDLAEVAELAQQGATTEDLGKKLASSGDSTLAALGLRTIQQARTQESARKAREAQAKESARRFGITTDLERDKIRATTENAAATRGLREAQTKKALADAKKAEAESRFGPKLSVTEKKAVFDAQDELANVDQTISTLNEALKLNEKAFSGLGAEQRGLVGDLAFGIGGEGARATREFGKLMSGEAIQAMANALKGVTTDFELQKFESILNDLSLPVEVRERTIQRMLALAQRKQQILNDRINSVRNRTAFSPTGQQSAQPQRPSQPQQQPQAAPAQASAAQVPRQTPQFVPEVGARGDTRTDLGALDDGTVVTLDDGSEAVVQGGQLIPLGGLGLQ